MDDYYITSKPRRKNAHDHQSKNQCQFQILTKILNLMILPFSTEDIHRYRPV